MKKNSRIIIGAVISIAIIVFAVHLWIEYGIEKSNPENYATIGDIPTPDGFKLLKDLKEGDIIYDKDGNFTKILLGNLCCK